MMGTINGGLPDPYQIDPLSYFSTLNGDLSPAKQREHYDVLRLVLARKQQEDPATFDLAVKEISKKLGITAKAVKQDLALLTAVVFPIC